MTRETETPEQRAIRIHIRMEYLRAWVDRAPTMAEHSKRTRIMLDEQNREYSTTVMGVQHEQ